MPTASGALHGRPGEGKRVGGEHHQLPPTHPAPGHVRNHSERERPRWLDRSGACLTGGLHCVRAYDLRHLDPPMLIQSCLTDHLTCRLMIDHVSTALESILKKGWYV